VEHTIWNSEQVTHSGSDLYFLLSPFTGTKPPDLATQFTKWADFTNVVESCEDRWLLAAFIELLWFVFSAG
jgi:hypothetical protein